MSELARWRNGTVDAILRVAVLGKGILTVPSATAEVKLRMNASASKMLKAQCSARRFGRFGRS